MNLNPYELEEKLEPEISDSDDLYEPSFDEEEDDHVSENSVEEQNSDISDVGSEESENGDGNVYYRRI